MRSDACRDTFVYIGDGALRYAQSCEPHVSTHRAFDKRAPRAQQRRDESRARVHAHSTNDDDQAMALAEALIEPHRSWRIKIASRCP